MTIQGDIFENESISALCSLTNMKLSARTDALGWLECQWLLLLLLTALNVQYTSEQHKYPLAAFKHLRRQASFQASSLLCYYAANSGTSLPTFRTTYRSILFRILEP